MTDCLFCRVVAGDLAAAKVLEEERCVAFLDHRPLFHGHVLVVPRRHVETLPELPGDLIEPLFDAARRVAAALPEALGCEGTFVAINNRVSQSVPHLHVHVVPRRKGDGMRGFFWPRVPYRDEGERESVRERIARVLATSP